MFHHSRPTLKFFARVDRVNAGVSPVVMRITLNRKKTEMVVGHIAPELWNDKTEMAKGKTDQARAINLIIENRRATLMQLVVRAELNNEVLTLDKCRGLFSGNAPAVDFWQFIDQEIERGKSIVSHQHWKHYVTARQKLARFAPGVNWHDLNPDFWRSFHAYMAGKLNNHPNTIFKTLSFFRRWLNIAVKDGYLQINHLQQYTVKKAPTNREYLTINEVEKLENLLIATNIPDKIRLVLPWFLFGCYTGLRYADLKALRWNDINENCIVLKQGKTGMVVRIPLTNQAKQHLPDPGNGYVFRVYSNQKCNDYLKIAAMYAGINKSVSFHVARHTFATISLNIGIPIEIVSQLLGHQDIKTTRVYAKLLNKTIDENMKRWDQLSDFGRRNINSIL